MNILWDSLWITDLCCPFCKRSEHCAEIDLLKSFPIPHVTPNLSNKENHRGRVLEGRVHAGRGICGAGPSSDKTDAWSAGQLAGSLSHYGGSPFLAADHEFDLILCIVKRVEHWEIALARDAEGSLYTLPFETLD
jgi:hypothetical protein